MERSESIMELAKALSKFQGEIHSVKKTSVNPFFKSKYADLDAVWEMCRKPLSSNGLALVQMPVERGDSLYLETLLVHTSGEYIKGYLALNAKELTPQAVGSAITYARRYAMSAMLGVSADEDDDAEKATARDMGQPVRIQPQPKPPRVITGRVCPLPGCNGAKLVQSRTTGVWGHVLDDGTPCLGIIPETPTGDREPEDGGGPDDTVSGGQGAFPDTPLGHLQREVFYAGLDWTSFENQILHMPWPEWVRLGGTIDSARRNWDIEEQKQEA